MPTATGPGLAIAYADDGAGPPVILVGGIASSRTFWDPLLPHLAGFRLIRPDHRGSGSTRIIGSDDGDRTPQRFAADVMSLADALDLQQFHLVGASMGGFIVQEAALRHPSRIRSLVIACSAHGGPTVTRPQRGVNGSLIRTLDPDAGTAELEAGAAILFHPSTMQAHPDAVAWFMTGPGRTPHTPDEVARRFAGMAAYDSTARLPALAVPTLVITGAEDRLVPPGNSESLAALIPDAQLEVVSGTAHLFHIERPQAVGGILARFMTRH